ncbi:lysine/arginine/ornithine transport system substrate-binding protein [Erwinia toletana]|uniref:Lysine/arginine/ornithine transport system substrate-binding protein n=1 Tax=Winslowiella toletana TaxID=92490 RepID=A0ABS4P9U7_9GAMM|nr:ABC transporter substrate-binding protein [Winslowiella toletana]MBP2169414.1 lysine/arginine/ornithine transport system substrate-binding protein [Winslowiella toletana]
MKKIALSVLLALTTVSHAAFAETQLRFGVDPTFPPFESKAADGSLQGFDIDMGNAICQQLQVKCVWVQTGYDGIIPALKARKFDAILSAMSMTDKRREQVAFSDRLYITPSALITRKNSGLSPDIATLKGKVIGVAQGTTQESYAQSLWAPKGIQVVSYPNQEEIYPDLASGRVDATFTNAASAATGFLKSPQGQDFAISGKALYDDKWFGEGVGIGLRKDDEQHRQMINSALAELHKNGTYDKLAKKYFTFDIYRKPE